ncbi:MAG: DUF4350 domain-containing protein [Pedobacter sp.]|nr:MAG: DUF4350 domain-containing protein [Pedobacter sp.]
MSGLRRYMIFGALLLVLYLVAQYTKPTTVNWTTTYLPEDKIPFGTYILRHHAKDVFPNSVQKVERRSVYEALKNANQGSTNYFIITARLNVAELDFKAMRKYMESGNNILIAAFQMDGALEDSLKIELGSDFDFQNKTKYPVNFTSPYLKRDMDYYFERGIAAQYFREMDTAKAVVLGKKYDQHPNLIQYRFGKGSLVLCPNPQLFTNYSLLNENGSDYVAKVFSYLPQAKTIIWDEYYTRPVANSQSVLRVLFSYDELRWAYYLALIGLVIFVLYEMKRRQRIIPILDPLKNSSVEFAQTIGRVYYQQRNHHDIIEKKISYFLAYLRNKYRIKTTEIDQEFEETLVKITGIDATLISQLMGYILAFNKADKKDKIDDRYLIEFNKLIEQFYKLDRL